MTVGPLLRDGVEGGLGHHVTVVHASLGPSVAYMWQIRRKAFAVGVAA